MCPEHQVGREAWCTLCARDYHHEESESPPTMSPHLAALVGLSTIAVSVAIGFQSGGVVGGVRAGVGTVLLLALAAVLALTGRRLLLRFRFVRTRPNRNIVEALENDGGVQSLVPPSTNGPMSTGDARRDPISGHIRLSGADVESIIMAARRLAGAAGRNELKKEDIEQAINDFIPSAQGLEKEMQELAAVLECTQLNFLPADWREKVARDGGRAQLQQRLVAIRQLVGE